ncbi:hypothetical protein AVEN_185689-1 [Araneus ventricosus]|uniref:Uncharacterized protein n=1 Tax=Araneus ventricosus TaxID=182803 RepID=A0A4Y2WUR3_ARAVE|nr:hypothetical protein AVEN_185689-1 [Araneus ventricosus]
MLCDEDYFELLMGNAIYWGCKSHSLRVLMHDRYDGDDFHLLRQQWDDTVSGGKMGLKVQEHSGHLKGLQVLASERGSEDFISIYDEGLYRRSTTIKEALRRPTNDVKITKPSQTPLMFSLMCCVNEQSLLEQSN